MASVSRETVVLGFQILDFISTNHHYGSEASESFRERLEQFTSNQFRPPAPPSTSRTRAGSRSRSDQSEEPPLFPGDWTIDKSQFRAALRKFKNAVSSSGPSSPTRRVPQLKSSHSHSSGPFRLSPAESNMADNPNDGNDAQPTLRAQIEAHTAAQITAAMNQLQANMQQQFLQLQQQMAGMGPQQPFPQPQNPENNQGPVHPGGPFGNNKEWNAEDIGYFDPDYDGEGPVVSAGKSVYYRDVYAFIERLKDMTPIRGMEKLRTVLPQCFRGSALIWHSTEVSERDKRLYRTAPLEEWYDILTTRFKERTPMALIKMQAARYTMTDAKNRKDPRAYVQNVTRYAKAANLTSVLNQLAMAWNNLDWEFRLHIPEPTADTTLQQFLESLDAKSDMWFEMARHRGSSTSFRDRNRDSKPSSSKQDNQRKRDQRDLHTSTRFSSNRNDSAISDLSNLLTGARTNRPTYTKRSAYNDNQNRTSESDVKPAHLQASSSGKSDSKRPYTKEKYVKEKFSKGTESDKKDYKGKSKQHAYVAEEEDIPENVDYYDPDPYYEEEDDNVSNTSSVEDTAANHTTGDSDVSDSELSMIDANLAITAPMSTKSIPRSHRCRTCRAVFDSNNKLHRHIRTGCSAILHTNLKGTSFKPLPALALTASEEVSVMTADVDIVYSTVDPNKDIGTGYGFRGYKYAQTDVSLWEETPTGNETTRKDTLTEVTQEIPLETPSKDPKKPILDIPPPNEKGCLDTGAGITIADNNFFKRQTRGKVPIRTMATPITVRGIGTNRHLTDKYAIGTVSLFGKVKGRPTIARFRREIHLVDDLKANLLVGTDILGPEKIAIDLGKREAFIGSCNVTVPIDIGSRSTASVNAIHKAVHIKKTMIIPPHTVSPVTIHHLGDIPKDRDYLFEPDDVNFSLYAHLMDAETSSVLVRNDTHKSLKIPRNFHLGHVTELDYSNACHVSGEDAEELALRRPKKEHKVGWFKKLIVACTAAAAAVGIMASPSTIVNQASTISDISNVATIGSSTTLPIPGIDPAPTPTAEVVMPNGVTIHDSGKKAVDAFAELVEEFPSIWEDNGFATLPEENWMKIPLKSDWESKVSGKAKIYPLGIKDREIVDKTFDELQALGRLSYTTDSTPFSYPCFVVWKPGPDGVKKGRVVIDIRGLNAITVPDAYPLPYQSEIIIAVRDCLYISVVDCTAFFYQWRVFSKDRHKLTVVSHRGQETFNVAPMGYKNSPSYVQRQIDRILRPYRTFARAYVDDIVIFSKTLDEHVQHLRQVFSVLKQNNISVKPSKAFLGYPTVHLLGQKVDSLGLATTEQKLAAISKLKFPKTLRQLEHYLGLTGWLREYVERYAKISEPLQDRKTTLLRGAPPAGNARRAYASRTFLKEPTPEEWRAYTTLQDALGKRQKLFHFSPSRVLYIDVDSSKESGIGGILYHVKTPCDTYPTRPNIEPIMFLSRLLVPAETRYWPTELELAGLVWILRKTRHLIEASQTPTIVYTDHGAALGIAKQTTLTTTSTDKLNLRLVRASDYIQRFPLDIRHKPGKLHIVPDALSRLATTNSDPTMGNEGELDVLTVDVLFTTSLVEMSDDFRQRLSEQYQRDPLYVKIMKLFKESTEDGAAKLPFVAENGLIFRIGEADEPRRLYIPAALAKDIFDTAHDQNGHSGFARCYERVAVSYYLRNLSGLLRDYLKHCPKCQVNQTRRHAPYGNLQPILSPPIPFHTITIDFILALPLTRDKLNCALTTTCKFSKRITIIPGKITWSAKDWALALLQRLNLADWGLPKVIISDRDGKFLADLWQAIFQRLGVSLLYSTAYHPQTDGQSERTNQSIEIALRHYIATLDDPADWPDILGDLQNTNNNSISASTTKTPNEIVYGFTPVRNTDLSVPTKEQSTLPIPMLVRREASDAIAFAQINAKIAYDRKHRPISMKEGDYALLRLHKGYNIPSTKVLGRKLSQQYAGPFKVLAKVGNLAYRLKLPEHWQIHPVFSIAQLEPCPDPTKDPFTRPRPDLPDSVFVEGDTERVKSYEIEKLITHRPTARRGIEYLVRWKGYGPEEDVWRNIPELGDAMDLVKDYDDRKGVIHEASRKTTTGRSRNAVTKRPKRRPRKTTATVGTSSDIPKRPRGRPRKS